MLDNQRVTTPSSDVSRSSADAARLSAPTTATGITEPVEPTEHATAGAEQASQGAEHATGASNGDSDDPVLRVISEFSEVFTFVRTRWAEYAEQLHPNLSRATVPALLSILRHGPVTATELTEILRADKTIVSKQVALLKQYGLVQSVPSLVDGRVFDLTVTDEGKERISTVRGKLAEHYRERFEGWEPAEIDALRESLHRFNQTGSTQ